jgi:class 3 adenylate cyclase
MKQASQYRWQESAHGGQIHLNAPIYEMVKGHIQAKPFEPTFLKGRTTPETVYELGGLN